MQSWLEIDAAAIAGNARRLAALAAPARLCAVVKSNAYGHGLVPASRAIAAAGIEGLAFGVFAVWEAFALREAGVTQPIIVLGPVDEADLADAAAQRIEVALLAEEDAESFALHGIRAHLKVETGTRRFGMSGDAAVRVLDGAESSGLAVVGLYSHLANAEDLDREFTRRQIATLKAVDRSRPLQGRLLHAAASAAAMMWPETRLDVVRCGISLYGAWPSPEVHAFVTRTSPDFILTRALRWFAPIAQIKRVPAGEPVGYGCTFKPEGDATIAVLGLGYADGLPRAAGNSRFSVRVGTSRAPIVGRVCMNACMVDVTDLKPAPGLGDVAEIDVEELAAATGTINYEILARLGAHLPRRYSA